MSDARRYAVWPEPRSRSLKGSRPSVPHGTNFLLCCSNKKGGEGGHFWMHGILHLDLVYFFINDSYSVQLLHYL